MGRASFLRQRVVIQKTQAARRVSDPPRRPSTADLCPIRGCHWRLARQCRPNVGWHGHAVRVTMFREGQRRAAMLWAILFWDETKKEVG
jgi:hypothetical protein